MKNIAANKREQTQVRGLVLCRRSPKSYTLCIDNPEAAAGCGRHEGHEDDFSFQGRPAPSGSMRGCVASHALKYVWCARAAASRRCVRGRINAAARGERPSPWRKGAPAWRTFKYQVRNPKPNLNLKPTGRSWKYSRLHVAHSTQHTAPGPPGAILSKVFSAHRISMHLSVLRNLISIDDLYDSINLVACLYRFTVLPRHALHACACWVLGHRARSDATKPALMNLIPRSTSCFPTILNELCTSV